MEFSVRIIILNNILLVHADSYTSYLFDNNPLVGENLFQMIIPFSKTLIQSNFKTGLLNFSESIISSKAKITILTNKCKLTGSTSQLFNNINHYSKNNIKDKRQRGNKLKDKDIVDNNILSVKKFDSIYRDYLNSLKTLDAKFSIVLVKQENNSSFNNFSVIMETSLARKRQCFDEYLYSLQ